MGIETKLSTDTHKGMNTMKIITSLTLLLLALLNACSDHIKEEEIREEEITYCEGELEAYVLTKKAPFYWQTEITMDAEFDRYTIHKEGDRGVRHFLYPTEQLEEYEVGDRLCFKAHSEEYELERSFTQPETRQFECRFTFTEHILEWHEFFDDPPPVGFSLYQEDSYDPPKDGQWSAIDIWFVPLYLSDLENPEIAGTEFEDGEEMNIYRYVFSIPETLVDFAFEDGQLREDSEILIDVWHSEESGSVYFFGPDDCTLLE